MYTLISLIIKIFYYQLKCRYKDEYTGLVANYWSNAFFKGIVEAENKFVGVNVGKLDQSCEVLCKKDHLLYLDIKDNCVPLVGGHFITNTGDDFGNLLIDKTCIFKLYRFR